MTEKDVLKIRDLAEHTVVQLKERLTRDCKQDVAEEMVCMSNSRGGMIVIGINDKTGVINPLSFTELQEFVVMFSRTGGNGESDRDDDRDNSAVERIPYRELTGVQKNIIQYCSIPRSAREILAHIDYAYHPVNIAKFIRPLVNMRYLEMMIPDKPNSKNQKYRKVL